MSSYSGLVPALAGAFRAGRSRAPVRLAAGVYARASGCLPLHSFWHRSFCSTRGAMGPLVLHKDLPCYEQLRQEGLWVEPAASTGSKGGTSIGLVAPLRVCILNLMPLKEATELQLSRMLARSPVRIEVTWCVPDNYSGKNSAPGYLDTFYRRFSQIKQVRFDGFIVTGAPVEHLPFEDVRYWPELQEFFEFVRAQDAGLLSLCWGAMASLYHFHGIPKHLTARKEFGVFAHPVLQPCNILTQAFPPVVGIPASRHATWHLDDVKAAAVHAPELQLVLDNDLVGPGLVWDDSLGHAHMINHFEYDADTLKEEYIRDSAKGTPTGEPIHIPHGYFPQDNPDLVPEHSWKTVGQVFYSNWVHSLIQRRWQRGP